MNAPLLSIPRTQIVSGRPDRCDRIALVLQGGGALGAYQAGVYQALHEAGVEPDWISGVSIGAINSALIAGNPPERRLERLRAFWDRVTERKVWAYTPDGDVFRQARNATSALFTILLGQPGFFEPRRVNPWFSPPGAQDATSYYDTGPLRETLLSLVDFDRLNDTAHRFSVGAVNALTGNFVYFDNATTKIEPEHVMASGALPPAFPTVRIGTDHFWDGGLVSNTPLQHLTLWSGSCLGFPNGSSNGRRPGCATPSNGLLLGDHVAPQPRRQSTDAAQLLTRPVGAIVEQGLLHHVDVAGQFEDEVPKRVRHMMQKLSDERDRPLDLESFADGPAQFIDRGERLAASADQAAIVEVHPQHIQLIGRLGVLVMQVTDNAAQSRSGRLDPHVLVRAEQDDLRRRGDVFARLDPVSRAHIRLIEMQPDRRVVRSQSGIHLGPADRRHRPVCTDPIAADQPALIGKVGHRNRRERRHAQAS